MELDNLWKIETYTMTDQGTREYQQDAAKAVTDGRSAMAVLCDGMGGLKHGEMASDQTVQHFLRDLEEAWPIQNIPGFLEEEARRMDRLVSTLTDEQHHKLDAGTTIVSAIICEGLLHWMSVGDSRLYVLGNDITQITRDHSLVEEMVTLGEINREQARNHAQKNIITRAIGGYDTVEAEMFSVDLKPKDRILMCSDGLSNMVEDSEILKIVKMSPDIDTAVARLVCLANENGGKDNITVMIIEP